MNLPSRRRLFTLAAGALGAGTLGSAAPALAGEERQLAPRSTKSGVTFEADFGRYGFDQYLSVQPSWSSIGTDLGIAADPLGGSRKVAWFDSRRRNHIGTSFPRAGVSSPLLLKRGVTTWVHTEFLIPSAGDPLTQHNDWLGLMSGAYGAPYGGSSPLGISVVHGANGKNVLNLGSTFHWLKEEVEFPLDQWVGIALNFKLDYDGWVELFLDRGDGFELIPLDGQRRAKLDTLRAGCNDAGPNDCRIGVYGTKPARLYVAQHVVGGSKGAVTGIGDY